MVAMASAFRTTCLVAKHYITNKTYANVDRLLCSTALAVYCLVPLLAVCSVFAYAEHVGQSALYMQRCAVHCGSCVRQSPDHNKRKSMSCRRRIHASTALC
jgi:hypothetical protein